MLFSVSCPKARDGSARHVKQTDVSVEYKKVVPIHVSAAQVLPNMTPIFLIGFAICFSFGLVLSSVFMYIDAKDQLNTKGRLLGRDYCWERALAFLFGIAQVCLSISGIAEVVAMFHSKKEVCNWLEAGVVCSLQLAVGTNVRTSALFIRHC
jgi:hypothetical protein